jgi:hypothetical protein
MAWFKVDDGFYTSQKVLMIPRAFRNEAVGAWLMLGAWSADKMTDGKVPSYVVDDFDVSDDALHWLVEVGLWYKNDDGIEYHDWCEYQPTRDQLQSRNAEKSAKRREAGIKSGEVRRTKREQTGTNVEQTLNKNEQTLNPEPEPVPIKDLYNDVAQKSVYTEPFETFWSAYPRKQQKGDAFKAWETLRKKKLLPHVSVIIDAATVYASNVTDPQFQKLPAGWLRASAWEDQVAEKKPQRDPNVIDFHDKPGWGFRNYEGEQK